MGKGRISIVILKGSGKTRQFRLSARIFRIIVIIAIFIFFFSLFSIYGFFYLSRVTDEMRERNEQIARELDIAKRNLNKVQSALNDATKKLALEKAISKKQKDTATTAQIPKEETNKSRLSSSLQTRLTEQEEATVLYPSEAKDRKVGIRNVRTVELEDPYRLQVNFTIFNNNSQNNLVKGRTIIVVARETKKPFIYQSYPQGPLRLGEPTNPKIGRRFAIRRFVRIKGYFKKPSLDIRFDKVTIFIYSRNGTLMSKGEFPIEERLDEKSRS
jgi:hypothetical protein